MLNDFEANKEGSNYSETPASMQEMIQLLNEYTQKLERINNNPEIKIDEKGAFISPRITQLRTIIKGFLDQKGRSISYEEIQELSDAMGSTPKLYTFDSIFFGGGILETDTVVALKTKIANLKQSKIEELLTQIKTSLSENESTNIFESLNVRFETAGYLVNKFFQSPDNTTEEKRQVADAFFSQYPEIKQRDIAEWIKEHVGIIDAISYLKDEQSVVNFAIEHSQELTDNLEDFFGKVSTSVSIKIWQGLQNEAEKNRFSFRLCDYWGEKSEGEIDVYSEEFMDIAKQSPKLASGHLMNSLKAENPESRYQAFIESVIEQYGTEYFLDNFGTFYRLMEEALPRDQNVATTTDTKIMKIVLQAVESQDRSLNAKDHYQVIVDAIIKHKGVRYLLKNYDDFFGTIELGNLRSLKGMHRALEENGVRLLDFIQSADPYYHKQYIEHLRTKGLLGYYGPSSFKERVQLFRLGYAKLAFQRKQSSGFEKIAKKDLQTVERIMGLQNDEEKQKSLPIAKTRSSAIPASSTEVQPSTTQVVQRQRSQTSLGRKNEAEEARSRSSSLS